MKSKYIKKISALLLLITLSLMFTVAQVSAAVTFDVAITDLRDGVVTISGNAGEATGDDINIIVLNPDYSLEDAKTDHAAIQQQWAAEVAEDGKFSYTFPFNTAEDFEKGTFLVYVGGNSYGEPDKKEFTFASYTKRLEYAKGVYAKATADGVAESDVLLSELADYLEVAANLLGANKAFSAVDSKSVALSLVKLYAETKVDFGDELPAGSEKDAKELSAIEQIVKDVNVFSAYEAFRESKAEVLFGADNEILVDDILALSDKVKAQTTLIDELENITDSGREAINTSLLGADFKDAEELAKLYAKSIILYGIKSNKQMGFSYVSDILTEANAKYAGISIPTYLSLSNKSSADSEIVGIKSSLTLSNLATKIEEKSDIEDNEPQSGSTVPKVNIGGFGGGSGTTVLQPTVTPEAAGVFNDIAGYSWAKEAIEALAAKNIIAGAGDGSFNPGGQLTREQAIKIVCLALGINGGSDSKVFADEAAGAWYQPYLAMARAAGIANGMGDNRFGIGAPISREDFAVMLYRALGTVNAADADLEFGDAASVAEYAKEAVKYFVQNKVINGYTDGTFRPKASISRAEASKLVYELIK